MKNYYVSRNRMDLFAAIEAGDLARVRTLIKEGADVNEERTLARLTPLSFAVQGLSDVESAPIVKALLEAGATVNQVDVFKDTPLIKAIITKKPRVVIELLKKGADIHATKKGLTILYEAHYNRTLIALLLASGADPDQETSVREYNPASYRIEPSVKKTTFQKLYLQYRPVEELNFLLQFTQANLRDIAPEQFPKMLAQLREFREFDGETYDIIEEYLEEKRADEIWKLRRPAVALWTAIRSRRGRRGGRRRATRRRSVRKD